MSGSAALMKKVEIYRFNPDKDDGPTTQTYEAKPRSPRPRVESRTVECTTHAEICSHA